METVLTLIRRPHGEQQIPLVVMYVCVTTGICWNLKAAPNINADNTFLPRHYDQTLSKPVTRERNQIRGILFMVSVHVYSEALLIWQKCLSYGTKLNDVYLLGSG